MSLAKIHVLMILVTFSTALDFNSAVREKEYVLLIYFRFVF